MHHWTVGVPVVNSMLLLGAIDADATFVFQQGMVWSMLAAIGPDCVE